MIKYFLLGNLILATISIAINFARFARSDEDTEMKYYEKLLLDGGYFFACFLITVVSLLFGWI